ncbi:hypothetical protein BK675_02920 [Pseudomonas fluorescens]|nr:hypothetical protein BK677_05060 [Pseudomonas fluorescens]ROO11640.1 hypothetical protein BK675_02920 [Pseudomonas fluorescens]ROO19951.1 hypothetical protein BK676_04950 [Pseudomonas fluorescens]
MVSVFGAFVGAGRLAKAFRQLATMADVPTYSRAGSLPQGIGGDQRISVRQDLWEWNSGQKLWCNTDPVGAAMRRFELPAMAV